MTTVIVNIQLLQPLHIYIFTYIPIPTKKRLYDIPMEPHWIPIGAARNQFNQWLPIPIMYINMYPIDNNWLAINNVNQIKNG